MIEAAGGAVWRWSDRKQLELLLIHRPRYDDWSLPKGKLAAGEPPLEGALREILEETGLRCRPGPKLAEVRYRDRKDRPKRVQYWSMQALDGQFTPNDEVDEVRWVSPETAASLLTYDHDREVLEALAEILVREG